MNDRTIARKGLTPSRRSLLVGLAACFMAGTVHAETLEKLESPWEWGFALGATSWSDLGDVQSSLGGDFDEYGFALDMSVHRKVDVGDATLLLGADLGFFSTDSRIPGIFEDLIQRGVYLTPSMRLRFGESGRGHFDLEAGAGWYNTDFAELDCNDYNPALGGPVCTEINDPFDSNAFGGYVGVRGGFNKWFTAGFRAHFADFGEVTGLPTVNGDLSGPVYTLMFGARF